MCISFPCIYHPSVNVFDCVIFVFYMISLCLTLPDWSIQLVSVLSGHNKCEEKTTYEFVYAVCKPYQISERRQVHADSDHAAGKAQLAELSVSLWKEHGEIEPTTGQHHPCCKSLAHDLPLKHRQRCCVMGLQGFHIIIKLDETLLTFCFV